MANQQKKVHVRSVWSDNIEQEFDLIDWAIEYFPYASIDTEFPGDIHRQPWPPLHNQDHHSVVLETYRYMKMNVDSTKLIQLGLTLCDAGGNLPDFGSNFCYIWEFNFQFDVDKDQQDEEAIQFLKDHGFDFKKNKEKVIPGIVFAAMFNNSKLRSSFLVKENNWVTFHGSSDFGYLIKILTQRDLPDNIREFMQYMKIYFGEAVYDMKHIAKCYGLYGGLEKIAKRLNVGRVAGRSHQAGSDSLLTMHAFMKLLKEKHLRGNQLSKFNLILSGLELEDK